MVQKHVHFIVGIIFGGLSCFNSKNDRGIIAFRKIDVAGKRAGSIIMQCAFRCYIARVRLAILKWEELQRVRAVSALVIENAWRRKAAYIRCAYLRSLRDGATGFRKCGECTYYELNI